MNHPDDTIAAIVTAPGEAGVAIVRLSGLDAHSIADQAFTSSGGRRLQDLSGGQFLYGFVRSAEGADLDEALALVMKAPKSFTGEDVVELQGHGGTWCARRILRRVLALGAVQAEPGEFSRRAFLNGRIDLVQAEAVLDLIHAQSERASAAALEQLEGRLSEQFGTLYEETMMLAADVEATLDFTEEELPAYVISDLSKRLALAVREIELLLDTWDEGHLLRDGALVVLAGRPNAGKSTLLNALLERDRAIVSDTPGTTRDSLEEQITLSGIPIRLVDTAGIRESTDHIEKAGISRTIDFMKQADIIFYLVDIQIVKDECIQADIDDLPTRKTQILFTKSDLHPGFDPAETSYPEAWCVSLTTGQGMDECRQHLIEQLAGEAELTARPHAVINERHRSLLQQTLNEMQEAKTRIDSDQEDQIPLASTHLREALDALGEVTGKEYSEALLDNIFSRFCVGK